MINRWSTAGFVPPSVSRTCLARKGFTETKRRRSTGRQPGTKSASRPADKPVITAGQPLILFFRRFTWDFACSCFWRDVEATFLRCLGRYDGPLFPWRTVLLAPNLARPCPAAPPGAPTRPARGMSGFWIRQVYIRIRLFVFPKGRSRQLSSLLWWARGSDVSWANRTVNVPSGPAMRRPAPTRPWYVRVLDSASYNRVVLLGCLLQLA